MHKMCKITYPSRIKEIVYYSDIEIPERWIEDFNISSAMFAEAGVEVRQV